MESGAAAILGFKPDQYILMLLSLHHHIWEFKCDMTMIDGQCLLVGLNWAWTEGSGRTVPSLISFATDFAPNASFLHHIFCHIHISQHHLKPARGNIVTLA